MKRRHKKLAIIFEWDCRSRSRASYWYRMHSSSNLVFFFSPTQVQRKRRPGQS